MNFGGVFTFVFGRSPYLFLLLFQNIIIYWYVCVFSPRYFLRLCWLNRLCIFLCAIINIQSNLGTRELKGSGIFSRLWRFFTYQSASLSYSTKQDQYKKAWVDCGAPVHFFSNILGRFCVTRILVCTRKNQS